MQIEIATPTLTCKRCSHKWTPRQADVRICPRCKSARWDQPRKGGRKPKPSGEKD